jgi:hypothetical protein
MELTTMNLVLGGVVVLALAIFLRALYKGGRTIGGFLDRRNAADEEQP